MAIYNGKHVVFEQVGVDSDTVAWNQSTNTDGDGCYNNWDISNIRNSVLPTKALALSSELYATLTNTTIQTAKNGNSSTLVSTSDKTFILAEKEMTASPTKAVSQESSALTTLNYWVNHNQMSDRIKKDKYNRIQYYWLRSPLFETVEGVVFIFSDGGIVAAPFNNSRCLAQCFAY